MADGNKPQWGGRPGGRRESFAAKTGREPGELADKVVLRRGYKKAKARTERKTANAIQPVMTPEQRWVRRQEILRAKQTPHIQNRERRGAHHRRQRNRREWEHAKTGKQARSRPRMNPDLVNARRDGQARPGPERQAGALAIGTPFGALADHVAPWAVPRPPNPPSQTGRKRALNKWQQQPRPPQPDPWAWFNRPDPVPTPIGLGDQPWDWDKKTPRDKWHREVFPGWWPVRLPPAPAQPFALG